MGREEKELSDLNTIDYHPIHITIYLIIISEGLVVFNINIVNIARNYYSSFRRIISSTRCYLVFLIYGRFHSYQRSNLSRKNSPPWPITKLQGQEFEIKL